MASSVPATASRPQPTPGPGVRELESRGRGRHPATPVGGHGVDVLAPPIAAFETRCFVVMSRYSSTAIALHWVLAAALLGSLTLGSVMTELPLSPTRLKLVNWHKWAGVAILTLSVLRLAWRWTHPPPPAAPGPAWQQRVAAVTHSLLYLGCFAVPLSGWAYSSAAGFPVVWFGVLPLPDLAPVDRTLAEALRDVHEAAAGALALLIALHVAAALKHQLIDRDGLMSRMGWPGGPPREPRP